ncbi:hypothetical protein [Pseudomonas marginalis]|uniref:hypothetical protein n=1 Tax=Pseudomonas marginalis TaxID=298 RepID=UPI0017842CB7|nr:hypothetical protein [Pseudomonas marginalis]MBD8562421.1 hypothetical protein [Pseudomonas fluorescens]
MAVGAMEVSGVGLRGAQLAISKPSCRMEIAVLTSFDLRGFAPIGKKIPRKSQPHENKVAAVRPVKLNGKWNLLATENRR